MPYYRALLSALTLFAGHFLNRRLDRVVVVFGALALVGVTAYVILPNFLLRDGPRDLETVQWLWRIPSIMVIAIAAASACITWVDARSPPAQPLALSTRIAGGMVSIFGLIVIAGATLATLSTPAFRSDSRSASVRDLETTSESSSFTEARQFHSTVHFGGHMKSHELPAPPPGTHPLRGRVLLDGRPVPGVALNVYLNESFKSEQVTDGRGEFRIGLPAGEWHVNQVGVHGWPQQPEDRDLEVFSEYEPRLGEGVYSRYDWSNKKGLPVRLPAAPDAVAVTLELRDLIQVQWPPVAARYFSSGERPKRTQATLETSVIRWQPLAAASEYQVQIHKVTYESHLTRYSSILTRRQAEPLLTLASLPHADSDSDDPSVYAVAIYAFDSQGKLMSLSEAGMQAHEFQIAGKLRLAEEKRPCKAAATPDEKSVSTSATIAKSTDSAAPADKRKPRCS